ncbi:copper-binding transcription factor, partial [Ascosphaera atra]
MSHLTVPQSTKNPRRTRVPRQKAVPLAKASTFNAPRCLLTPVDSDEEEEELEKLEKDRLHTSDSVMANNQGNDGGDEKLSQKIDQKIDALRLPVLSVSRVMTRSHTDTRALENAVTEGSRTVDLWERLERLRLDEKNTESKEKQRAHDDRRRSNGSSGASNTASPSASGSETDTETGSDSDDEQHENLNANSGSNSANLPTLSVIACRKIESHVLLPLLRRKELTCFQPLIRSLPPRMQSGEIATLRDLEKTLLSMSVNFAISNAIGRNVYTAFAHYAIQCLHSTVPMLCDRELKKQHERAYNGLYFLDLVEQVRQYAAIVGHARIQRAAAAVVKRAEEDMEKAGFESDDEIILVNGIANEGRPAELVRRKKDGSMFSLSTGKPYHVPEQSSEKDMQKRSWTLPKASESRCPARPNQGEHTRDPFPHSAARRATLAPQIAASLIRRKFGQSQSCSGPRAPLALLEPGTKRPSLTFTPEPPSDVSRSMARRKKNEPPMNINKKCEHCDKVFRRRCDYTKHSKTHSRPFKCPVIGCRYNELGWPTEKEKDRHYNDKHCTEPILHHCKYPNCTYKSKRESNCKQHMEKAHGWCYVRTKQKNSISGPTKK